MSESNDNQIIEWGKLICLAVIAICFIYIAFHMPIIMEHLQGIERGVNTSK